MTANRFRAVFFGSPAFAVPSLVALADLAEVAGVVCQPDKPAGRGLELTAPAVKVEATRLGLPVLQPTKLKTGEFPAWIEAQRADVALVVAYGRILPPGVLGATRTGCVNVHASLLPKYRGAAPIVWAIARGEVETGVTLMKLDEGMDTGPTFARLTEPIGPDDTARTLSERLAQRGAEAVRRWLPAYVAGECRLSPQDHDRATTAPMLEKRHGRIDWTEDAARVQDHVRAMNPWPGAATTVRGKVVKVHAARVAPAPAGDVDPGRVVIADKSRVLVRCGGSTAIELTTVQPEGKRPMTGVEWSTGRGVREGDLLE